MPVTAGDAVFIGNNAPKIPVGQLKVWCKEWMRDAVIEGHTTQSIKSRRSRIDKFFWFLSHANIQEVGVPELKDFIYYLQTAHEDPRGRWNNARCNAPMTPIMVGSYYRIVKAFYNWLILQEYIQHDYMRKIRVKKAQPERKPPISVEDLKKLFRAAKLSRYPKRDEAALRVLLDTGLRATEWCSVRKEHYDEDNFCIRVKGKGDKWRTVELSPKTVKALDAYLKKEKQYDHEALILSKRGMPLTYSGLYQIIKRLSHVAGIKNPGCHAFRRSFAVYMRRNRADLFAIQTLLGHSDITMTRIYTQIADTDTKETHRRCSPVMHFDF